MNGHLLFARSLSKRYSSARGNRPVVAFDDVTLRIHKGEIIAVLGPSGCGKSTLLKVLAGLEQPTSGCVTFQGQELERPQTEIGIVFQEDRLLPWLTVRENIIFSQRFAANRRQDGGEGVEAVIARLGLADFSEAYPGEISGGMAQRVALARALWRHPKLLLFDEPFAALDAFHRMEMQDWVLRLLKERGTSALFVTHDIDEALYVGDRIMIMTPRPGRVARIVDNPVSYPRRRDDGRLITLRHDIIHELVSQGAIQQTNGGIPS